MRILLVEDEPTLRAQLSDGLQSAGYAVDVADNGRDAQFLGEKLPANIIMVAIVPSILR